MTDDTQENYKVNWGHEAEAVNDGEWAALDGLGGGSQRDAQSVSLHTTLFKSMYSRPTSIRGV
jgi:hypothetical protein